MLLCVTNFYFILQYSCNKSDWLEGGYLLLIETRISRHVAVTTVGDVN